MSYWRDKLGSLVDEAYHVEDAVILFHGDCRDILPRLPKVDLVLTDPPYGHNNNNNGDLISRWEAALGKGDYVPERDNRPIANDGEEANELIKWFFAEVSKLLKPGACCCCCGGGGGPDPQFARWSLWLDEKIPFKMCVVWDKGPLGMGWHYRRDWECVLVAQQPGAACKWYGGNDTSNVIRDITRIIPNKDQHPTEKPVRLFQKFITWHSQPGELILDSFIGGGASAIAAKQLGRRCIGIELEKKYLDIAIERLRQGVLPLAAAK